MQNRVLYPLGITLPLTVAVITGFPHHNSVFAQLTPDNTLGAESSIVTPQQLRDLIQGGAIRGNALFHSFDEFNVGDGGSVFFDLQNNADILNIFTRVTGTNSSNILGTLGVLQDALNSDVLGNANLFLLNPNGITFGGDASLQLNGSFFATTADGFGFDDFTFSASGQEAPPPLLTVSIPRFLSFRDNPGDIVNQSIAQNPDGNFGLQVPSRESLTLVGGNVNFQTGWIVAPGARVEIGGLAEAGTIGINDNLSLSLPNNLTWGDISFRNTSFVNVSSNGGGSITINALNLDVSGGSQLAVGITSSSDSQNPQSGDINLNATESITLSGQDTVIFNQVATGATGNAGDVLINAPVFSMTDGAQIASGLFGNGSAGLVQIEADIVSLDGQGTTIFSQIAAGSGTVEGILIDTDTLSLTEGAVINVSTLGIGNAGNTTIDANTITLDASNIFAQIAAGAQGSGGNIDITTDSLELINGASISAATFGEGDAGNITINATDSITFDGVGSTGFSSAITANVQVGAVGDAGDIEIVTNFFSLTNGGFIGSNTFSQGDGGSISINANTITLDGGGTNNFNSGIQVGVVTGAQGDGGSISIVTDALELTNGAQISANTFGIGNAGNTTINASTITLNASNIFAQIAAGAQGFGGNIDITSDFLNLTNGASISASTFGVGDAGNITISATDAISIDGVSNSGFFSGIFAIVQSNAVGNAGDITITADSLLLTNTGRITTATLGQGDAGNIRVNVADTVLIDGIGSGIFSTAGVDSTGNGGSINIDPQLVLLRNGALISVNALGNGRGGNIFIDTNFLVAFPDENSDIITNTLLGGGAGRIDINAQGVFGLQVRDALTDQSDIVAFSEQDPNVNGLIIFNTPETNPQPETEVVDPSDIVTQSACYDFGGDSQLSNTGRGGIPQIPGLVVRNSVVNVDLVDEVPPAPPPEAIKPHHRTDVIFLDSNGEEFKPAMGAVLLPNGMVEFVDYNPAEVYRDMYAAAGCN